ncbi:MAG TPA: hypothetical protein VIR79_00575 [Nitrospira sp.]
MPMRWPVIMGRKGGPRPLQTRMLTSLVDQASYQEERLQEVPAGVLAGRPTLYRPPLILAPVSAAK